MFAGKKSAQIREILISESTWEEMTCLFAPSLTEGAIGYAKLDTRKGYQIMGVIRLADGSHPPLGISVKDKTSHKELGLVADGGFVYLNGIQDDSKLTLRWGDKSCFIQPPNSSNLTTGTVILPCISQN